MSICSNTMKITKLQYTYEITELLYNFHELLISMLNIA